MIKANITLRLERPEDYRAVEELTREAFWKNSRHICDEHLLVNRLRKVPAFVPELDYLEEVDGRLAGHIIYSRSRIEDDSGKSYEVLTFGPLSVLPEYQNRGVGKALMLHMFEEARRLGYRALGCSYLDELICRSEREISLISGIDRKAADTVREIMLEHGFRWGEERKHAITNRQ